MRGKITVKKMDGTPLPDTTSFTIQGQDVQIANEKLDQNGQGYFTFKIPKDFLEDFFGITFTVKAQGLSGTKADSIAIIQNSKLFVDFTPESSIFVRGVENQVFFESWVDEN